MSDTSQDMAENEDESIGDLKNRLLGKIAEYAEPKAERVTHQLTFHLHSLYKSGEHSDLTIKLRDGTELQCHRSIVCSQCSFFENALKPGRFKESYTGVIEMLNDHPKAIRALIEFLYTFKYCNGTFNDAGDVIFHADVSVVANIYQVPELRDMANQAVELLLENHFEDVITGIPHLAEIVSEHDPFIHTRWGRILFEKVRFSPVAIFGEALWASLLADAPNFVLRIMRSCEMQWMMFGSTQAGRWLDRIGSGHAVGLVDRTVKCPRCSLVAKKTLSMVGIGRVLCRGCQHFIPCDKWLDAQSST